MNVIYGKKIFFAPVLSFILYFYLGKYTDCIDDNEKKYDNNTDDIFYKYQELLKLY